MENSSTFSFFVSLLRILRAVLILRNAKMKHPSRTNLAQSTAMIMMMD